MSTVITQECINCGACEPECPNTAIYCAGSEYELNGAMYPALSADFFFIVPEKCSECVGFFEKEACAAVCPVDCCIPDPDAAESEEVLIQRARNLHPDKSFGENFPSRFRAAVALSADHASVTPPSAGGGPESPAAATVKADPAPPTTPDTKPPAAPTVKAATPPSAADTKSQAKQPAAQAAKPVTKKTAEGTILRPAAASEPAAGSGGGAAKEGGPRSGKATAAGAGGGQQGEGQDGARDAALRSGSPGQDFPGESDIPYEIAEATMGAAMPADIPKVCAAALALASPLLGAMNSVAKRKLERMIGNRRVFSSEVATGLNVVLNFALYPCLAVAGAGQSLFSTSVNAPIALAALVASLETAFRLRDGFKALPVSEMRFGSALYGPPLTWLFVLAAPRECAAAGQSRASFEGYYGGRFDAKVERLRRYGRVWELDEREGAYYLRLELPRLLPESAAKRAFGFGDEMPDYALELNIRGTVVTIEGHVMDERVRRLCSLSSAFPSDFRTQVELGAEPDGFRHRYRDKVLEILFFKKGANTVR